MAVEVEGELIGSHNIDVHYRACNVQIRIANTDLIWRRTTHAYLLLNLIILVSIWSRIGVAMLICSVSKRSRIGVAVPFWQQPLCNQNTTSALIGFVGKFPLVVIAKQEVALPGRQLLFFFGSPSPASGKSLV